MSNFEVKKDFTADLKVIIEESITIAAEKSLDDAIIALFSFEKKCRINNDITSLKEVCIHIIRLCKTKSDWLKLNAALATINKRSSLIRTVIIAVVNEALLYVKDTPSLECKVDLIKALKEICDGKIYVESESANLHFMLSKIYEDRGDITEACEIIQDVHVETYGSLSKKEKAEYILEQMRLNLLKRDYIRVLIHSRKMNLKTIEEDGFAQVKIRFYTMMVEYHSVQRDPWEVCQAYYKIASTKIPADETKMEVEESKAETSTTSSSTTSAVGDATFSSSPLVSLESCIIFLLLSKFDNHHSDMLHRLKLQIKSSPFKELDLGVAYTHALTLFTTHEIIIAPFEGQRQLEAHPSVHKFTHLDSEITASFQRLFIDRVIQHNIRVIARYYKRIRMTRLSTLLNLSMMDVEKHLSDMSAAGDLHLKIDRPIGIVDFVEKQKPEEVLTEWSNDMAKMMQLMESTCHLIHRENMVYKV